MNYSVQYGNSVSNNFSSVTTITSGSQSITSTLTRYSVTFAVPGGAFTGLQIEFALTSFTSGTFDLTGVQLEPGTVATPFERRSYGAELALCQRYFQGVSGVGRVSASNGVEYFCKTPVTMRATPTATIKSGALGYQFGRATNNLSGMATFYLGTDGAGLTFTSADTGMTTDKATGCTGDVAFLSSEL
jgi:hypothetical protein